MDVQQDMFDDRASVNGVVGYYGNRAQVRLIHNSGFDGVSIADFRLRPGQQRTSLQVGTSIAFADGHFAFGAPITGDAFAIVYPHESIAGKTVTVGSGENVRAVADGWGPAVVTDLPAYAPAVSITISGTFLAALGDLAGGCAAAISFNRSSLPASMMLSGGGTAALPYTLQTSNAGGNSLLYTGGGIPSASNALPFTFPASVLTVSNFSVAVTVWAQSQPSMSQQAGSYIDNITLDIFTSTLAGILQTKVSSQAFTVTGAVAKSCTIGGADHPAADTAQISITASGSVNTAPINRSYANAFCNTPANVQMTSQNGAVTAGGSGSSLQRLINYAASATFSGAATSLDTATVPTASGPEAGATASTTGSTPTGSLGVSIIPQLNAQPLAAGSYVDTLAITLTPQCEGDIRQAYKFFELLVARKAGLRNFSPQRELIVHVRASNVNTEEAVKLLVPVRVLAQNFERDLAAINDDDKNLP